MTTFPTEFVEKVNIREAYFLLSQLDTEFFAVHNDQEPEYEFKLTHVKKILQTFTRGGGVKKTSYKKSVFDINGLLRWYANSGLQGIPAKFRGLLCKGNYTDLDMRNAHPQILRNLCIKHNIPHRYLEDYCENRNDLIQRRQTTKVDALKSLNKAYKQKGTPWFNSFDMEIKAIQKALIPFYPDIWTMALKKSKTNHEGRFTSYVCQYFENKILEHVVKLCPFPVATLMFDGFMVEGKVGEGYLDVLTTQVFDEFGMDISWSFKEHDTSIVVPDDFEYEENFHAEDDSSAAKYVLDLLDGRIYKNEGLIYYKLENKWITNQSQIEEDVCQFIMSLNIRKMDGKPYSSNVSGTRHIYEALKFNIPVKNLRPILHSSTKCKICFRNGVLDLRTGVLSPWEECDDVETAVIVEHDFVPHSTSEVKHRMFSKMFGNDLVKALKSFSRAIAGHVEDKRWIYYLGSRNCGKGSLFSLLKSAFGDYVKGWNVASIMYHSKKGADIAEISRKLYWLLDHEYTRIAISQEVPDSKMNLKINGSLLKRLAGGGDEQVCRRNYDTHDQHIVLETTFLIFGNSGIECDSPDAFDECLEISTAFEYKSTQEEIDAEPLNQRHKYILGDPSIKEWVKNQDVINACISLMVESYSPDAVPIVRDREINDEVKLIDELLMRYEVGRGELLGDDIFKEFSDKKKVKAELLSMGVEYKKMNTKTHRHHGKWCFFGIRDKADLVEDI